MSITPEELARLIQLCEGASDWPWSTEYHHQLATPARVRHLLRVITAQQERIARLEAALREIALGRGSYSRDRLEHAENTIKDMKAIAQGALDGTWASEEKT